MIKLPGLSVIKQWLLNLVIKWVKQALESESARGQAQVFGVQAGRVLGKAIPGDQIDLFIAAFIRGVAEGLEELDAETMGKVATIDAAVKQALKN